MLILNIDFEVVSPEIEIETEVGYNQKKKSTLRISGPPFGGYFFPIKCLLFALSSTMIFVSSESDESILGKPDIRGHTL